MDLAKTTKYSLDRVLAILLLILTGPILLLVGLGILGVGALLFTLMSRVAIHVANGTFRLGEPRADADSPA